MYTKLTFTNSSILTASNGNQLEENILETRVANIGSGPPSSAELLSGNLWTKTASDQWILNILQGSLQWSPLGFIDTDKSVAAFNGPQICLNSSGGPFVSSQELVLTSLANVGSWYKIGPTVSGSYQITWSALDDIPRTTSWIAIRTHITSVKPGSETNIQAEINMRTYNGSVSVVLEDSLIAHISLQSQAVPSSKTTSAISSTKIQVNSDNGFELRASGDVSSGSVFLIGYGHNHV